MHIDVSRAYFHAKAQRLVLLQSPVEDRMGADAGEIGSLKKSMYGTRYAPSNWERHWKRTRERLGISAGAQLEESVSSGKTPGFRNDTWRRLRAHGTDRTTDRICKQNDRDVSTQSKTHQLRVNGAHQSVEQKVALNKARKCVSAPETREGSWTGTWQLVADSRSA